MTVMWRGAGIKKKGKEIRLVGCMSLGENVDASLSAKRHFSDSIEIGTEPTHAHNC